MSQLTVQEFIDVVIRSQLVEHDQLIHVLADCKREGQLPADVDAVADFLCNRNVITSWQKRNLRQGKSRGFFLGNYRLLNHVGTGGMSSVFLAEHLSIKRQVAIKVMPSSRAEDADFLSRFQREAIVTSRLSHPNVVRVFDIDEQDGTHFIVMEYVEGPDLKAIVKKQGPLRLELAAHYIAQAATGLQHAHERGLVHRDVKPANLVVTQDDLLKVLDLGLARVKESDAFVNADEAGVAMMGTADYLAPEQAVDAHAVDHRADIYSLGCTMYFLLSGHPPFPKGSIAERLEMHRTQKPRDIRAEREDCPHAIAHVCMTMLSKDPNERFAAAGMVAQRLHRWIQAHGHRFSSVTYATSENIPSIGQLQPSETLDVDLDQSGDKGSLVERREARRKSRVKTPIWLWAALAISVIACGVLCIYAAMRWLGGA